MARVLVVDKATLSRWETGKSLIPPTRCAELATLTGLDRHDLRPDIFEPSSPASAA